MAAPKAPVDESMEGAPLYMVSFGDMMTIMLTFFILLCSYSKERQAGFISDGIGSFQTSLNAMGLPGMLPGSNFPLDLGAQRSRYRPAGALNEELLADEEGRISEANRDKFRDVVKESLKTDKETRVPVTLIFERRATALSDVHIETLKIIAKLLKGKNLNLRFKGFAYEEGQNERITRSIAAQRALSAAKYMTETLGIEPANVQARGWGSGGMGKDRRKERVQQDRLGRRIVLMYFVPPDL